MSDSDDGRSPADYLSAELVEHLDTLSVSQLRAVSEYARERLSHMGPPTEAEVRADVAGTIVDIERQDLYTLVWKQSPEEDDTTEEPPITSLYLVQRERTPDGEERLHWSYLGVVDDAAETECAACGTTIQPDASTCPHCGSEIEPRQEE